MTGYSSTPLNKKLGLKPGFTCLIVNAPDFYFDALAPLPPGLKVVERARLNLDFIHLFVQSNTLFEKKFASLTNYLSREGMLWVSWPKKSSKVITDLDENRIRTFGLKSGLVDVKVCAINQTWSGLKFVFRLKDR
jgi:hypothetical protein